MGHLDLPRCFEASWGLASQVGPWAVLELLARALLGPDAGEFAGDPIWTLLATLDGRQPRELPGSHFHTPDVFYLPSSWVKLLSGAESETWHWSAAGRCLRLWSDQGYVLFDCPMPPGQPATGRDHGPVQDMDIAGLNAELARWLNLAAPAVRLYMDRLLDQATHHHKEIASDRTLSINNLLQANGRLYVTGTHVDLVISLAELSLPVRLAGLDFNPGWLVDFGRVVTFHYE
jgi:hypothetical protein